MTVSTPVDSLGSGRRFVLGGSHSARIELDFFNLYGWLLQFAEGNRVLDVACGSGLGAFLLAHKARRVVGVDVSPDAIAHARKQYSGLGAEFHEADVLTFDFGKAQYDVVVCAMTLEQLPESSQLPFLKKLCAALDRNGQIILVTPNKQVTAPGRQSGGHGWNARERTLPELAQLLEAAGFHVTGWFGRRVGWRVWTWLPVRKLIGGVQRMLGVRFGFFGTRESPVVQRVRWWHAPKDVVVLGVKR